MDWMVQKMDLSELDLDSLMDPCDSGALPSPPEDLLSSLGGSCDLDLELGGYLASLTAEPHSDPSFIPEPPAEPEPPVAVETLQEAVTPGAGFVSEPLSSSSSSTPALEGQVEGHQSFSLELGSEVDIDEAQETRTEPVLLLWKDEAQTPETQLQTQETEPVLLLWKQEAQTPETQLQTQETEPVLLLWKQEAQTPETQLQTQETEPVLLLWKQEAQTPETQLQTQETEPVLLLWKQEAQTPETQLQTQETEPVLLLWKQEAQTPETQLQTQETEPVLLLWKQEAQTPETQLQTQETEPVLLLWKQEAQTPETQLQTQETEPVLLLWKQEAQTPETQLQTQETEPVLLLWKEEAQTMEIEGYCSSDTDSGRGSPERSPSPSSSSSSEPRKALSEPVDHPSFSQELGCEIDIDSAQEALSEPGLLPWKQETQAAEIEGYCSSDTDSGLGSSCGSPERSPPSSSSSSSSSSEPRRAAAKPYSRPTREEQEVCVSLSGHVKSTDKRKMKKMEQNKTAATRYRQKKRSELDRLRGEREALEEKNRALGERAEAIATEIRYLTELMREVREARDRRLQQGKGTE
ncbi:Cyclic AMP-dependent transcription factor ATF-4 [Acipenser ruthenus]|uniref:Cyclic AMP-dependent transcription factor ATF-4 n=1 Tax=Acipenser ruthenus TaxID=7906 RepID=A0A444V4A9_ACIRT|nr:Cyclic AMP-dependent transcription factor ATF-4 [Acipenser ruthenus]